MLANSLTARALGFHIFNLMPFFQKIRGIVSLGVIPLVLLQLTKVTRPTLVASLRRLILAKCLNEGIYITLA